MAITESWFKQDLKKPVIQRYIVGNFFSLDNVGNLVGVEVYDNGAEATLSGSVTGYCALADGTTVPVSGTRSGNQAYILLPQSVLSITGYIGIVLKLTDGNTITTLLSIIATVYPSQTDEVITPSQQVITDWSQQINAALQNVVDASAAQDEKIADLKSAIIQDEKIIYNKFGDTTYLIGWVQGYIRDDGTVGAATKKCRTNFKNFNTCEYAKFTPKSGYILDIAKYTSNTPDTFVGFVIKGTTDPIIVNVGDGNYYCFIVSNTSNTAITPESLPSDVVAFDKLEALTQVYIDSTLTESGKAADAKKVGDELAITNADIDDKYKQISTEIYYKDDALDNTLYSPKSSAFLTLWSREYIRPDGTIGVATKLCRTNFKNFTNSKYYKFTPQDGYHLTVVKYASNTQASFVEFIISQTVRSIVLDVHEGYYCFVVGKVSNEEILTTEADTAVLYSPLSLNFVEVTDEVPKISEINSSNMCLAGIQTAIRDNALPYARGYLFHEFTTDTIGRKLYFGNSFDKLQYIGDNIGHDPFRHNYAISPTDGSIIVVLIANNKTQIRVIKDNTYTNTDFEVQMSWLYNSGVDFIKDPTTGDEYCVFAEYGANPGGNMYVYRGKYPYTAKTDWSIVKTVIGEQDIHHFHMVRRDPWTNILYLTSGDADNLTHWWYSTDCGATWSLLANGSDQASTWGMMACRTINFIFTKDYIYWATDSYQNHMLCRIQRNSNTGAIDLSTFEKLTDLKPGCATNSLCYSEAPHGLFMYERIDSGATAYYGTPVTMQFYSLDTNTLEDVLTLGLTENTWGGSRGKCYINYTNPNQPSPAMGFDGATPCIFDLIYDDPAKIGTVVYDIKGKTVKDVLL